MLADARKKNYDVQNIFSDTYFDILNLSYERNKTKENVTYQLLNKLLIRNIQKNI